MAVYLQNKRCFINIKNQDKLCCARAIVTGKAKLDNDEEWNNIRLGRREQLVRARVLHKDAGKLV